MGKRWGRNRCYGDSGPGSQTHTHTRVGGFLGGITSRLTQTTQTSSAAFWLVHPQATRKTKPPHQGTASTAAHTPQSTRTTRGLSLPSPFIAWEYPYRRPTVPPNVLKCRCSLRLLWSRESRRCQSKLPSRNLAFAWTEQGPAAPTASTRSCGG